MALVNEPSQARHLPPTAKASSSSRLPYLDYLKVFLTFTVIIHHCFYIFDAGWFPYYGEWLAGDKEWMATGLLSWTVMQFNQSYFMGLFFFISGLLALPSLSRKGLNHTLLTEPLVSSCLPSPLTY